MEDLSCYLTAFSVDGTPDYVAIQNASVSSADWYGFLMVLPDNQVCLIHSLGRHCSGLGRQTQAHNRFYGLLGEKVGDQLPPLVMAPSTGLVPWLKIQDLTPPTEEGLRGLEQGSATTILETLGINEDDELPTVSVQNMCYVPKPWAAHFLAPMTPWQALKAFRALLSSIPAADHGSFEFIEAWLRVACTHTRAVRGESVLAAKWQRPHLDRTVLRWIQRHTQHVNQMPAPGMAAAAGPMMGGLDPQECFNKALGHVPHR